MVTPAGGEIYVYKSVSSDPSADLDGEGPGMVLTPSHCSSEM